MRAILIALALLTATWAGPGRATITWTQSARGCLYREPAIGAGVFIGCYAGAGRVAVTLGGPLTDAAYRPTEGDVYRVDIDGTTWRARLLGRVLLPMARA